MVSNLHPVVDLVKDPYFLPRADITSFRRLDMERFGLMNGYSTQVRGWLVIDGLRHELAQVGPDFCILREPVDGAVCISNDKPAELVIEVDGSQREVAVVLSSSHPSSTKRCTSIRFRSIC